MGWGRVVNWAVRLSVRLTSVRLGTVTWVDGLWLSGESRVECTKTWGSYDIGRQFIHVGRVS